MPFAAIPEILDELQAGRTVLLVDDRAPDSHGDLVCAAEKITEKIFNFMATHARGLIRLSLPIERCSELQLEVQSSTPPESLRKAFTISIDAKDIKGPGISARNRVKTILTAIDKNCQPADLIRPGHVLPLRAQSGGVLVRAGKTEGSVDLSRLAGFKPAGVFCEVLDEAGDPMRLSELEQYAIHHHLKVCTIPDLIHFRLKNEKIIERVETVEMPTEYGNFLLIAFSGRLNDPEPHLALCKGGVGKLDPYGRVIAQEDPILVRVQQECLPGCVFGSQLCDCGRKLSIALSHIEKEGKGALVLLRQSQNTNLKNAIHPHAIESSAKKTLSISGKSGNDIERRDFGLGSQILQALGLRKLKVLTDSKQKIYGLEGFGMSVMTRIPIQ